MKPSLTVSPERTVVDVLEPCGPTIGEDTTVDQANDLLAARPDVPHLIVVDDAGRCEGVVTRASLAAFIARNWYSRRTAVRDTHHQRGPFAWPALPLALAAESMRVKQHTVWPVTDDDGRLLGVLTLATVRNGLHPDPADRAARARRAHDTAEVPIS